MESKIKSPINNKSGYLKRYNKEKFKKIKNKINEIFSIGKNDYYIKNLNDYIYIYYLEKIPVIICYIIIKDKTALFRLVKVSDIFKSKGYCSFFIENVIKDIYKKFKIKEYILFVLENNISALKCYKRVGFEIIGKKNIKNTEYLEMKYILVN